MGDGGERCEACGTPRPKIAAPRAGGVLDLVGEAFLMPTLRALEAGFPMPLPIGAVDHLFGIIRAALRMLASSADACALRADAAGRAHTKLPLLSQSGTGRGLDPTRCVIMRTSAKKVTPLHPAQTPNTMRIGTICALEGGKVHVLVDGEAAMPRTARLAASLRGQWAERQRRGERDVLLLESSRGLVIVDFVDDSIVEVGPSEPAPTVVPDKLDEASDDGETVTLEGKKQLVLRCGKATITLTRAGKVIINGAYVSTHSSGVNRIRGGSVRIN